MCDWYYPQIAVGWFFKKEQAERLLEYARERNPNRMDIDDDADSDLCSALNMYFPADAWLTSTYAGLEQDGSEEREDAGVVEYFIGHIIEPGPYENAVAEMEKCRGRLVELCVDYLDVLGTMQIRTGSTG
ncbi:hypothetical protein BNJ_00176 [Kaumoebavirus]|uniref:hypothetical protein n=1 Tax=Kaumoebavirus TaxID=1859492 RepID=UPI0009C2ADFB|nr:hypothetical protein BNJ_00176 [Kaumoebavirus]ARA72007.1 hypothetical protein BNJ_00176 [Kaumoebavirus]